MSIRKPNVTTISTGYSPSADWRTNADYAIAWNDDNVPSMQQATPIEVPDWADKDENMTIEAFDLGGFYSGVVVVVYRPKHTLGVGYAKAYMTDAKTKKMFPQMKGIWKETSKRMEMQKLDAMYRAVLGDQCKIDKDGKITSAFGIPSLVSLTSIVQEMIPIWNEWERFPKVKKWETICELRDAIDDVRRMRDETRGKHIESEIEEMRAKIKDIQEEISHAEKSLNTIYEKAADGMNLLEKHGVKVNLEDDNDDILDDIDPRYKDMIRGINAWRDIASCVKWTNDDYTLLKDPYNISLDHDSSGITIGKSDVSAIASKYSDDDCNLSGTWAMNPND